MMVRRLGRFASEAGLAVVLVVAWYFGSASSTSLYFPPLQQILDSFSSNWLFARATTDLLPSLERLAIGYLIACVVGIAGGVIIGSSYIARRLAGPIITFFRSLPSAALLPVAIQLLGVGSSMKVFLIAFVCVWPILLNTTTGMDETDPTMLETARSYGIGLRRRLTRIVLPAAAPRIFAGLRLGLAFAITVMIISEITASTGGLGYFISQAQNTFAIADMWSGIILIGLLGYVLNLLFTVLEHRVLSWYFTSRAGAGQE
jgi:ABC-type nitrate/sulfonate/bicarbonate transport system permease component